MNDADNKEGAAVVLEWEGFRSRKIGIDKPTESPACVASARDEKSDSAGRDCVVMGIAGFATKKDDEHIKSKRDQGCADETLTDAIEVCRESEVKEDDGGSKDCDRECVSQRIEQPQTHAFAPSALYARDICNGCQMVVIEAVPKS